MIKYLSMNFTNNIRNLSVVLIITGLLGLGYGFLTAPSTIFEAKEMVVDTHHSDDHDTKHSEDHGVNHDEHLMHQLQNRPWAALYVAALFFFIIPLGVLAFYAINRAAQAGWPIVLYRIMEGITGDLSIGSISVFIILVLSVLHLNHLLYKISL